MASIRSKLRGGLPHLEKHFLKHFFALRTVYQHTQNEAEHARGEHVVEAGERCLLASCDTQEQLGDVVDGGFAVFAYVHPVDNHIPSMP